MPVSYNTSSRGRILEFLKHNSTRAVGVQEIHESLSREGNVMSITTVYRFLEKLSEEGQVMKYNERNGMRAVYQFVEKNHGCDAHLHLQCTECGTIEHLDCGFMGEIARHVLAEHGFKIQCKGSVIYGLCAKCLSKGSRGC